MSDTTKTFSEWEKHHNQLYKKATDEHLKKSMSGDDFWAFHLENISDFHGVNHTDRTKFLQDNGFEVTRENMVDHRLATGHKIAINGEFIDYEEYLADQKLKEK